MFCVKCGYEFEDGSFCPECGHMVDPSVLTENAGEDEKKKKKLNVRLAVRNAVLSRSFLVGLILFTVSTFFLGVTLVPIICLWYVRSLEQSIADGRISTGIIRFLKVFSTVCFVLVCAALLVGTVLASVDAVRSNQQITEIENKGTEYGETIGGLLGGKIGEQIGGNAGRNTAKELYGKDISKLRAKVSGDLIGMGVCAGIAGLVILTFISLNKFLSGVLGAIEKGRPSSKTPIGLFIVRILIGLAILVSILLFASIGASATSRMLITLVNLLVIAFILSTILFAVAAHGYKRSMRQLEEAEDED